MPRSLRLALPLAVLLAATPLVAQPAFDGLGMGLGNLSRLSTRQDPLDQPGELHRARRARPAWPPRGPAPNAARDLGQGWKVSPSVRIKPKTTFTLADIAGPGAIQHIWMTPHRAPGATLILRFYWDGETTPSVEVPVGDFFASGWGGYAQISSLAGVREPRQRLQLLLGDAVPQALPDHGREPRRRRDDALLPDQLRAHRGAGRRRLLPRPVPAGEPAALQGGLHDPRRRRGRATTSAPTWPGASTTTAGGARARSSSTWTATASSRPSAAPAPRTTSAAPTTSRTRRRSATRSSPRPTPACPRSSGPTASTARSSASACTAGTSWTRSASSRTCG